MSRYSALLIKVILFSSLNLKNRIATINFGYRAALLIACVLWLYALFRIKACFRKHAYCLVRKHNAESGQGVRPRRARPEACICGITTPGNGIKPLRCGSRLAATCFRSRRGHNQLIEVPLRLITQFNPVVRPTFICHTFHHMMKLCSKYQYHLLI